MVSTGTYVVSGQTSGSASDRSSEIEKKSGNGTANPRRRFVTKVANKKFLPRKGTKGWPSQAGEYVAPSRGVEEGEGE